MRHVLTLVYTFGTEFALDFGSGFALDFGADAAVTSRESTANV